MDILVAPPRELMEGDGPPVVAVDASSQTCTLEQLHRVAHVRLADRSVPLAQILRDLASLISSLTRLPLGPGRLGELPLPEVRSDVERIDGVVHEGVTAPRSSPIR
jgi:hypothetical protein